jgi:hypothetical protein
MSCDLRHNERGFGIRSVRKEEEQERDAEREETMYKKEMEKDKQRV